MWKDSLAFRLLLAELWRWSSSGRCVFTSDRNLHDHKPWTPVKLTRRKCDGERWAVVLESRLIACAGNLWCHNLEYSAPMGPSFQRQIPLDVSSTTYPGPESLALNNALMDEPFRWKVPNHLWPQVRAALLSYGSCQMDQCIESRGEALVQQTQTKPPAQKTVRFDFKQQTRTYKSSFSCGRSSEWKRNINFQLPKVRGPTGSRMNKCGTEPRNAWEKAP